MAEIDDIVSAALRRADLSAPDHDRAVAMWAGARADDADAAEAMKIFTDALTREDMQAAAQIVLDDVAAGLRDTPWPLGQATAAALKAGAHDSALAYATALRAAFPENEEGARLQVAILLKAEKPAEAAALLRDLGSRFATAIWRLEAAVAAAEQLQDYPAMLKAAEAFMAARPKHPAALMAMATALHLAGDTAASDDAVARALARVPAKPGLLRRAASLAETQGRPSLALSRWAELRQRFPEIPQGYTGPVRMLREAERLGEIPEVIAEGLKRFPDDRELLLAAAQTAEAANEKEAAYPHWRRLSDMSPTNAQFALSAALSLAASPDGVDDALRGLNAIHERFPDFRLAYEKHLELLIDSLRLDEAAEKAAVWHKTFPEDREIAQAPAIIAAERLALAAPADARLATAAALAHKGDMIGRARRWPKVFHRLNQVHERFPGFTQAYAAHVECLIAAGRLDEAAERASAWETMFPASAPIALARAEVYAEMGDPEQSLAIVTALRGRAAPSAQIEVAFIKALSGTGQHDQAEAACAAALVAFPTARALLSEHARLATRLGDWQTAQARLLEAQRLRPDDATIGKQLLHARIQLAGQSEAEIPAAAAHGDAAMFGRFESLGGSFLGCEFGTVQRSFGAESLGLLRWTRVTAEDLIKALTAEFEGVGSEETTILKTVRNSANVEEYVTADRNYGMKSNTFVKVADAPYEKMFSQTCRRLRFLRGRLLEDLRLAEKIFVFKAFHPLADATMRRLHAALRRYGDVALLCVMKADPTHGTGTVRNLAPGLFVGYVGFFMKDADRNPGSDRAAWREICSIADERFRAQRAIPQIEAAA